MPTNTQNMTKSAILAVANKAIAKAVAIADGELAFAYNLAGWGPTMGRPNGEVKADEKAAEMARRFAGWLPQLAKSGACRRLRRLVKTCAGTGMNSPTNMIDMWALVGRYPTPEAAAKMLHQIEGSARIILAPFGIVPSNKALAAELQGYESPAFGPGGLTHDHPCYEEEAQAGQFAARKTLADMLRGAFGLDLEQPDTVTLRAVGMFDALSEPYCLRLWMGSRLAIGEFNNIAEARRAKARLIQIPGAEAPIFVDPGSTQVFAGINISTGWGEKSGRSYSDRNKCYYSRPGSQPVVHLVEGGYLPVEEGTSYYDREDDREKQYIDGAEAVLLRAMEALLGCDCKWRSDCAANPYRIAYEAVRAERLAAQMAEGQRQIDAADQFARAMAGRMTVKVDRQYFSPNFYVEGECKLSAGLDGKQLRQFLDAKGMTEEAHTALAVWQAVGEDTKLREAVCRAILSVKKQGDSKPQVGHGLLNL